MWLYYALTFAICSSLIAIISKKILGKVGEYFFIWVLRIFTIIFLFLAIIFLFRIPHTDLIFWVVVTISSILSALGAYCDYKSIKISEVSLIAPIASFNPVFTVIISFIFLGENVGVRGIIGIMTIVAGAYMLKLSEARKGFFAPIKALFNNPGVRLALLGSFIWSVEPILFKVAIFHTVPNVPPFISLVGLVMSVFLFTPLVFKFSKNDFPKLKKYFWSFLIIGILAAVGEIAGFTAYSLTNLGFAVAVFRLSMIFTVILGWIFYKERGIKDKLIGTLVMLVGVVALVI
jgi:uncharacterized membrane protein